MFLHMTPVLVGSSKSRITLYCKRSSSLAWSDSIVYSDNSQCTIVYETDSNPSVTIVETMQSIFKYDNTIFSKPCSTFKLVVKSCEHFEIECSITVTTDASLKLWGGHLGNQIVQGHWTETEKVQHINCSEMEAVHRTQIFSSISQEETCSNTVRQHHSCTVYKQVGRNKIPNSESENLGFMANVTSIQNYCQSCPCDRKVKRACRPVITNSDKTNRMDTQTISSECNILETRSPLNRSFCISSQPQTTSFYAPAM
jgi:hypothetical protein